MRSDAPNNVHRQIDVADLDRSIGRLTGVDAQTIASASPKQTRVCLKQIEKLLSRERNKGIARHWAYDLNRHIILKHARDRLIELLNSRAKTPRRAKPQRVANSTATIRCAP